MRRIRKDATKVWHNPELNTFSRRGGGNGGRRARPPESHAEDRRQAKQHRAALEALFAPKREPEARRTARPRGAASRANAAAGRRAPAGSCWRRAPQSDPRTAERQKLLGRLLVAEGRPKISKAADDVPQGRLHLPRGAGRVPPAPRARRRGARPQRHRRARHASSRASCPSAAPCSSRASAASSSSPRSPPRARPPSASAAASAAAATRPPRPPCRAEARVTTEGHPQNDGRRASPEPRPQPRRVRGRAAPPRPGPRAAHRERALHRVRRLRALQGLTFCRGSKALMRCHYCVDSQRCVDSTHCRASRDLVACNHCVACDRCAQSSYLVKSIDCTGCTYCFGCVGLSKQGLPHPEPALRPQRLLRHHGAPLARARARLRSGPRPRGPGGDRALPRRHDRARGERRAGHHPRRLAQDVLKPEQARAVRRRAPPSRPRARGPGAGAAVPQPARRFRRATDDAAAQPCRYRKHAGQYRSKQVRYGCERGHAG